MKNIKVGAIRVNQIDTSTENKKEIYAATIKVRDLINDAQFRIDYWDPAKKASDNQGYQRHPHPTHFRAIGKYALDPNAIFPGAILISCRDKDSKVIFHDNGSGVGELELQHPPFWIIDGQHRVKGLQYCIEELKDEKWLDRDIPVVILAHFSKIEEVAQFNTINSTAKRVSTDLAQQLMLFRSSNDKDYKKSLKDTNEEWKMRALKLIEKLNEAEDSPWAGRIKYPNSDKTARQIVGQNSFLVSLKPLYTSGYFESTLSIDHEYEIICNYWDALREVFPFSFQTPDESVILKTPGIFSLHSLLRTILMRRGGSKDVITKQSFTILLKKVFADKDDYFWSSGNKDGASLYGSMKAFKLLADEFIFNLDSAIKES